jgi:hypothetical protein
MPQHSKYHEITTIVEILGIHRQIHAEAGRSGARPNVEYLAQGRKYG